MIFVKKNVKRISIRINDNLEAVVTYPLLFPKRKAEKFARKNEAWINNAINEKRAFQEAHYCENVTSDEAKKKLIEIATPMLKYWETVTGLKAKKLRARYMTTRWGSYSRKTGAITLSTQLLGFDEEVINYIVLHELAHVKYPNHGADFKFFVAKYMPNWKEHRASLH